MSTIGKIMISQDIIESFKVVVRIRPLSEKEKIQTEKINSSVVKGNGKYIQNSNYNNILVTEDNLLFVLDPESLDLNGRKERNFVFDNVFTEKNSNFDIYNNLIRGMVDNVINGFNSTALAYGVTGTGKTHTMFGDIDLLYKEYNDPEYYQLNSDNLEKGICIYGLDYLFDQINKDESKCYNVKISYLEIYNEQVIDLLVPKSTPLMIVEDSINGVVVPDLTEYKVSNSKDMLKYILEGNTRRTMAPTNQNQFSSRSHAILQVIIEQRYKAIDTKEEYIISKLLIVDLAGSERGGLEKGIRTQEGSNINKSLLSLGNCINILSDKSKKGAFVPYRDSKLTRLLKDSLGGNISTLMIACVSPSPLSYDETVNTLKYATRARTIQKKIMKNVKEVDVHISQYKDIIDSLKGEIDQLKEIIRNQQNIINENINYINIENNSTSNKYSITNTNSPRNSDREEMSLRLKTSKFNKGSSKNENQEINDDNIKARLDLKEKVRSNNNLPIMNIDRNRNSNLKQNNCLINSYTNKANTHNYLSKSINNNENKNRNFSNALLISRKTANILGYSSNKYSLRTVHTVNLDNYMKFLVNIKNSNIGNTVDSDEYKNDMTKNNENFTIYEELEKQIDNLQNDKMLFEEFLESKNYDKSVSDKYHIINSYLKKYLELINDKLIENIEQNMILKFNLKEIQELNNTNNQNLNLLYNQLSNLEQMKPISESNLEENDELITKLKVEINSIKLAIEENEKIKENISNNFAGNFKIKKILKKILVKIVSNTNYNKKVTSVSNNKSLSKGKYEQTYRNLIKEKTELENKNFKFRQYLEQISKEKKHKDSKLNEVQRELELLKIELEEKNKIIRMMENKRERNSSNQKFETNFLFTTNEEDKENLTNTIQSEGAITELNLQDNSISTNNKLKFIKESHDSANENQPSIVTDTIKHYNLNKNFDKKRENSSKTPVRTTFNQIDIDSVENIKNIINQTNNIVSSSINKIINKNNKKNLNESLNANTSNSVIVKDKSNLQENGKLLIDQRALVRNKNQNSNLNKKSKKLAILETQNSNILLPNHLKQERSHSKSPRTSKTNKYKEFDKIIENQLNEVYSRKAKELGDKMKKKIGRNNNNNNVNKKDSNKPKPNNKIVNFNSILDKFIPLSSSQNQNTNNRSLSISNVSVNNEADFNSEFETFEPISQIKNNTERRSNKRYATLSKANPLLNSKLEELNNKNSITENSQNVNSLTSSVIQPKNSITPIRAGYFGNKNFNVQKFLSNNNAPSDYNFDDINTKKASIQNKRNYSPNIESLKQARFERQLKNQAVMGNINIQDSQIKSNLLTNYLTGNNTQNVKKFINKNTVDFVNDYLNNKKLMFMNDNDKSEDNDFKPNSFMINNKSEFPKLEDLEQTSNSIIDIELKLEYLDENGSSLIRKEETEFPTS